MAGSFRHVTTKKGKLRKPDKSLLDHMGDANEAIEEMYGMIIYLAQYGAPGASRTGDDLRRVIEDARVNYKDGLLIAKNEL